MSDMISDLRESLKFTRQHEYLDDIEAYIDQTEMDNLQYSVEYNRQRQVIFALEQRLQLAQSQYNNLVLISQINKMFVRRGFDPWRKENL